MGVGSSVPKKDALAYVKTIQGKNIVLVDLLNKIFKWMLETSDILDYYALADSSECSKYAKGTEEALTKLFKVIQVQPSEDKKSGKIYFQKLSVLKQIGEGIETTNDNYQNIAAPAQKQACMQIAYFYIRILQIYSALALSVLDTNVPESYDTLLARATVTPGGKVKSAPFTLSQVGSLPLAPPRVQSGGVLTKYSGVYISNEKYALLNLYLTYEGGRIELTDGTRRTGIEIPRNYIDLLNGNKANSILMGAKLKDDTGENHTVTIALNMGTEEGTKNLAGNPILNYVATVQAIELDNKDLSNDQITSMNNRALFRLQGTEYRFGKQNIAQWIVGIFRKTVGLDDEDEEARIPGYVPKGKVRKSVADLPPNFPEATFGVKKLAGILKDSKPKAYCVSRALQLLSPEHIYKDLPTAARTRICNSSFALSDSVPILGKPISDVKGLFYLDRLFYDKIARGSPSMSEELVPKHKEFMNELKALYEQQTETLKEATDISKISEKPAAFCSAKGQAVSYATKDKETIRNLRTYVGRLLNRQIQHTQNVVKLLSELFIITATDPLEIQPSVWKKGMPEIERIATRARELLAEYYSDCETTYQEGALYIAKRVDKFEA